MARLAVFSDDAVLVCGVLYVLQDATDISLDNTCTEWQQLPKLVQERRPDVLLLDLSPDVNLSLIADVRKACPDCKVILWARSVAPEFSYQAMTLGIRGILRRTLPLHELLRCIRKVACNDVYFDEALTSGFFRNSVVKLTRRENELVSLLTQGLRNKEIAYKLSLSEGTVKVYLSRLFDKLGVSDRFELALFGLRNFTAAQVPSAPAVPNIVPKRILPASAA